MLSRFSPCVTSVTQERSPVRNAHRSVAAVDVVDLVVDVARDGSNGARGGEGALGDAQGLYGALRRLRGDAEPMRAYEFSPRWMARKSREWRAEEARNLQKSGAVTRRQATDAELQALEQKIAARRRARKGPPFRPAA